MATNFADMLGYWFSLCELLSITDWFLVSEFEARTPRPSNSSSKVSDKWQTDSIHNYSDGDGGQFMSTNALVM
ncbi:hypothetical protein KIN20_035858 [Parelaphostrongylus tenuis]|uniref:Uncharacterized protein n=1 Tax=Parelaphostrongylus tenuis TaxID=148309 RepID=A0AAD5RBU8_PARTN|nr:hypothetical protein KIN20_035858 [Parelaphostrongylus tenuis]